MRDVFRLLLAFVVVPVFAHAEETVFCGSSLGHKHIAQARVTCPDGSVCLNAWFHWSLQVEKVLAGQSLPSQVSAAAIQHSQYLPKYERGLRIFTVEPIEEESQRRLLGAEYLLIRHTAVVDQYAGLCPQPSAP